jgi:hydrogenase maturation protease
MPNRTLVIGYGNVYCRDDGVAFYIINLLRQRARLPVLQADEDGLDGLGHPVDTILLHQLVPEIVSVVIRYEHVVFIDAHKGTIPDEVRVVEVHEEFGFHAVTHHMSPGMLLALARKDSHPVPKAHLVSVKGDDFDFGLGLSEPCLRRAEMAEKMILDMMNPKGGGVGCTNCL